MRSSARFGVVITALAALVIAFLTLIPSSGSGPGDGPFCIVCGSFGGRDVILNVLLFGPLGLGLALLGVRQRMAIAIVAAATLTIEFLQFGIIAGRDASLGDAIMNTTGGIAGFLVGAHLDVLWRPGPRLSLALATGWSIFWLAAQVVGAYAFVPAPPAKEYYGQIARRLGGFAPFRGRVLDPAVDTLRIPDFSWPEWRTARDLLARSDGALVHATAIAEGCDRRVAPIIRVVARGNNQEIILLGQQQHHAVFGIRTGADVLRLGRQRFRLRDAFGPSCASPAASDTVRVEGRYTAGGVSLAARRHDDARRVVILPRVADSWRLVAPMQTFIEPGATRVALGALWVAGLAVPLGFWSFSRRDRGAADRPRFAWVLPVTVLSAGLLLIPISFGLRPAAWWEIGAAVVGCGAGASLARAVRNVALRTAAEMGPAPE